MKLTDTQQGKADMTERDGIEQIIIEVLMATLPVVDGQCSINEPKANQLAKSLYPKLQDRLAVGVSQSEFETRVCTAISRNGPWYEGTGEVKRPSRWANLIYSGLENKPPLLARI